MTTQIRNLFDPNKDIYRTIEKVITYAASQESRLKAEISEYVVTNSIEEQFRKLLDKMQLAMEAGGQHEIGVWVSGFYGSGKSSFTKYLGFAFDSSVKIESTPFLEHLQNRLHTPQVKALLAATARRFPAAVVMLDLASEMLAGATMADISSVLYFKVLQWAGYSRNLKIAALERKIEKDGRWPEFEQEIAQLLPGMTWKQIQNDPLVVDELIPSIAHKFYPSYYSSSNSFSASAQDFMQFEDQRVQEMIEIVREKSGKQHIIFVIDEVGQYIASRDNLILNLDGLAKNLKRLGDGKVWIISTAQQTLTEDDPRAQLNSDKLYKLKDRFPIQVDLESSDIKEICYRRLLGKSPAGQDRLAQLFSSHGQSLRHNTKLQDAKYYDSDFKLETFINLYPFLPAHFDILIQLLGILAKSTGGLGLRSAIKVIQDILVESSEGRSPAADHSVGWLATTVTLYDALEKDIRRAFPAIHHAVHRTCIHFHGLPLHIEIAKSIAVLQILGNMPVTPQNIASLMHPTIDHPSRLDEVRKTIEEMLKGSKVLGEQDGNLLFLSEKLSDIQHERGTLVLRSLDIRRIFNEALRSVFEPLPKTTVLGTLSVTAGLKIQSNNNITQLEGDRNDIQIIAEMVAPTDYEASKKRMEDDSRQRTNQNSIFLVGQMFDELDQLASEIYRSQRVEELYRNDVDQEVKKYCHSQLDRATTLALTLKDKLKKSLSQGSFIFRGQVTAVSAFDPNLTEAAKKLLADVAVQVFNRYSEAPQRVDTPLAEKFLRLPNLSSITAPLDPLGLVEVTGGKPHIKTDHKAIISIRDFINHRGTIDGKHLLGHFSEAPFSWAEDTVRYILAAMLWAGEIKLKISGHEVTTVGQQAIEVLKTNRSFASIGVSLRDERPSTEVLARAAERLSELIGEMIIPLEQDITKATAKTLPNFQHAYGSLEANLRVLTLAGSERMSSLARDIKEILSTDASDAPQRLGSEESALYENLKWAANLKREFDNGLEATICELQIYRREIEQLPDTGVPGELRRELAEDLEQLAQRLKKEDFYQHTADLNSLLTNIKARVRDAVAKLGDAQQAQLQVEVANIASIPEWSELNQEEQQTILNQLDLMKMQVSPDLTGLRKLLAKNFDIQNRLNEIKSGIKIKGQERLRQRLKDEQQQLEAVQPPSEERSPRKLNKSMPIPAQIKTVAQIDDLIRQLQEIKAQLAFYAEIELNITIQE